MGSDPTFEELAGNPRPVGIECGQCLRRVLIDAKATLKPRQGDKRRVSQAAPLRCSRCGSRAFAVHVFQTNAGAITFMKGYR